MIATWCSEKAQCLITNTSCVLSRISNLILKRCHNEYATIDVLKFGPNLLLFFLFDVLEHEGKVPLLKIERNLLVVIILLLNKMQEKWMRFRLITSFSL